MKRKRAFVLMYHSFSEATDGTYDNVTMPIAIFEQELQFLKKHYRIVPLREIIDCLKAGKGFQKSAVALTFDDGYRSNFTLAYPLLVRHQAHATVFLTTGLIGSDRSVWVNELHYAVMSTRKGTLDLVLNNQRYAYSLGDPESRQRSYAAMKERLKDLAAKTRELLLQAIYDELQTDISRMQIPNYEMLSWQDIACMDRRFVEFGCHTATHAILTKIGDERRLKAEVTESYRKVREHVGDEDLLFCYPNGDFDEQSKALIEQTFSGAVSTVCQSVQVGADPYAVPRVGADSGEGMVWNLLRY